MPEAIAADGTAIHYRASGRGRRPLVLVHGWAASLEQWVPATRYLNPTHRVIRVDLRGHGRSGAPAEGYDLDTLARDLLAVLDAAALPRVTLVGHSLGATVCAATAVAAPSRVAALALVDGPLRAHTDEAGVEASALFRLVADAPHPDGVIAVYRELYAGRERDRAESFIREALSATSAVGARETWRTALTASLEALAPRIQCPTLYLAAETSGLTVGEVASALPGARFELVADSGHFIHLERPRKLASLLSAFADEFADTG